MRSNVLFILILGAALYLSRHQLISLFKTRKVPVAITHSTECIGKKKCAIIYLAPWCPACNSMIPHLQGLMKKAENHPSYGFKIIVGKGQTEEENLQKAKEIGGNVSIDSEGSYASSLNITYFPTIMLMNEKNKIELQDQDAMNWMMENF